MKFRNRYNPNKPKPKRLYSVGWLTDELDRLTSLIVRLRGGGCVTCPSMTNLTNGHIFTRTWRPTRFDIEPDGNCHVQCMNCQVRHEEDSTPFKNYYVLRFGERALESLEIRAHSHDKMGYADLVALWESHKAILETERKRVA